MNMEFKRKLIIPKEIKEMFPVTEEMATLKKKRDAEIKDIIAGRSKKFMLIIGPCSADNEDAVIDYISRLIPVQEKVADKIFIVPRIYTNKPRTTGKGYKGLLHQPDPNLNEDMLKGIIAVRETHIRAVKETGFTCADEMLYPENHRYLSDLLSYVAVGARSVEDQQHRLTASGLDIPVGMKNPTSGDFAVMMNSITAAQSSHTFIYRGWEVTSKGNPYAHAILRGYVNKRAARCQTTTTRTLQRSAICTMRKDLKIRLLSSIQTMPTLARITWSRSESPRRFFTPCASMPI